MLHSQLVLTLYLLLNFLENQIIENENVGLHTVIIQIRYKNQDITYAGNFYQDYFCYRKFRRNELKIDLSLRNCQIPTCIVNCQFCWWIFEKNNQLETKRIQLVKENVKIFIFCRIIHGLHGLSLLKVHELPIVQTIVIIWYQRCVFPDILNKLFSTVIPDVLRSFIRELILSTYHHCFIITD